MFYQLYFLLSIHLVTVKRVAYGAIDVLKPTNQTPRKIAEIPYDTLNGLLQLKVGSCTYKEVLQFSMKCESEFFANLLQQPQTQCRKHLTYMQECKKIQMRSCIPSSELPVGYSLDASTMSTYCEFGSFVISRSNYSNCQPLYNKVAHDCVRSFASIYAKFKTDNALCSKYIETRSCLYKAEDDFCEDGLGITLNRNATRMVYKCWNPFCFNSNDVREGIDSNCGRNDAFKYFRRPPLLEKFADSTKSYTLNNRVPFPSILTTTSANNVQTIKFSFLLLTITIAAVLL